MVCFIAFAAYVALKVPSFDLSGNNKILLLPLFLLFVYIIGELSPASGVKK